MTVVSRAHYSVVRSSFPRYILTSPSLASPTEHQEALSVDVTGEKNARRVSFLSRTALWSEFLMTHCSVLEEKRKEKKSPREKVWSTGF